jgi:putative endonuclease
MRQTQTQHPRASHTHRALGVQGEALAAEYLESLGWQILDRNWRDGRRGELDLVVRDRDVVIAVEVKTRSGTGYGTPFEAITSLKASRLRRLLLGWVREHRPAASNFGLMRSAS